MLLSTGLFLGGIGLVAMSLEAMGEAIALFCAAAILIRLSS